MHEFYVTDQVLNIAIEAAKQEKARRIKSIRVSVGELTGINPECMQLYFELLSPDTLAVGAELVVNVTKASLYCPACCRNFVRTADFSCPQCGTRGQLADGGQELVVEAIDIET